jgi:hypothetical protein
MTTRKKATDVVAEENNTVAEVSSDVVEEKTQEQENAEKIISGPTKQKFQPVSAAFIDEESNTIGSRAAAAKKVTATDATKEKPKKDEDEVAIFSPRHIHAGRSMGIPSLHFGFNIMDKKSADIWLNLKKDVRLATPEEVAKHYKV